MSPRRWIALMVALVLTATGLGQLSGQRGAVASVETQVGLTPVTIHRLPGAARAPAVVIAHGFAGSQQMMLPHALTLAQAGYVVVSFDFLGHGRNSELMRGDVTGIGASIPLLMDQTAEVIGFALAQPNVDGRLALLGHGLAGDVMVRQASRDKRVDAVVAISMSPGAVTATKPPVLLMISGGLEGKRQAEALAALHLVDPAAGEGGVARAGAVVRQAIVAPGVEHVGVLYSRVGLMAARAWLNAVFARDSVGPPALMGGWIAMTLVGLVLLAWPLSGFLPADRRPRHLTVLEFGVATAIPAVVTPLLASTIHVSVLPVLVADYLALHLTIYGMLTLLTVLGFGLGVGRSQGLATGGLLFFGLVAVGGVLDTYVISFMPAGPRPFIILAIAVGAVPYMIGEARLLEAGYAPFWRTLVARGVFLTSLGVAVMMDLERLLFLLMVLPVILVFFLVFGTIGGWVGRRTGASASVGIALGILLAWTLGVTFPLFEPV